jgi:hypothetical protein
VCLHTVLSNIHVKYKKMVRVEIRVVVERDAMVSKTIEMDAEKVRDIEDCISNYLDFKNGRLAKEDLKPGDVNLFQPALKDFYVEPRNIRVYKVLCSIFPFS